MAKSKGKQALGRGLSALLKDPQNDIKSVSDKNADQIVGNIIDLDLNFIEKNPFQPRVNFDEERIEELASSIKELGVIQPITVRKLGFEKYQLISGERRTRASKRAGLKTIPAFVRLADDKESLEMALVENIQRDDLNPIEISLSYQRLIDEISLTQEDLSKRVGKKRSTISNYLRLLKLDPTIQTAIRDGHLSMGHGRALINVKDRNLQLSIYKKVISRGISVRETEFLAQNANNPDNKSKNTNTVHQPSYITKGVEKVSDFLDSKVEINLTNSKKGKLIISFDSKEDFENIIKKISIE